MLQKLRRSEILVATECITHPPELRRSDMLIAFFIRPSGHLLRESLRTTYLNMVVLILYRINKIIKK
jgi:hypothetical protein